ncbi:MAG: ankyrin repeat domain-containing protein [Bdellovibrionales bacterium]|nr:ankyrin repeat domain-containing protein [Bdellovibrionales bacterium]
MKQALLLIAMCSFSSMMSAASMAQAVDSVCRPRPPKKEKYESLYVPKTLECLFRLSNSKHFTSADWECEIKKMEEEGARIDRHASYFLEEGDTRYGAFDALFIFIKKGKRYYSSMTALHRACFEGNLPLVKALVELHASRYEKTKNGETPLSIAVARGHLHICEYLIESKKKN